MTEAAVILVHGLWMNGLDMTLLRRRIAAADYATHQFRYPTVRQSPAENARDLAAFASRLPQPVVHFVGHSLGGLVLRHLFHAHPDQRPGRVVTLGTPHQQSSAARGFLRLPPGRRLLGRSLEAGLLGEVPGWNGGRDLGSIAGTLGLGPVWFIPDIPRPCDGTVAVSETLIEGMRAHVTVPATHMGLLISRRAAMQCLHFLEQGRFIL